MSHKLFFMHIPKTAGTSVHESLSKQFPFWRIPHNFDKAWRQTHRFQKYDFLGGHVAYERFQFVAYWTNTQETYKKISFVRAPLEHIASHIAWNRIIAEPAQKARYDSAKPVFKNLSKNLKALDLSNPLHLAVFLKRMGPVAQALFDNCMVRYFASVRIGDCVTEEVLERALQNMETFDAVGVVEQYDRSMALIHDTMGWSPPRKAQKRNANPQRFGLNIEDETVRKVLEPFIQYDRVLYERACARLNRSAAA